MSGKNSRLTLFNLVSRKHGVKIMVSNYIMKTLPWKLRTLFYCFVMGICGYTSSNYLEIYADNFGCMWREIFLLEQRKCSYESVVETPDLGSGPTSDIFLHICVSLYFSQSELNEKSNCLFIQKLACLKYVITNHVMLNFLFMMEWLVTYSYWNIYHFQSFFYLIILCKT